MTQRSTGCPGGAFSRTSNNQRVENNNRGLWPEENNLKRAATYIRSSDDRSSESSVASMLASISSDATTTIKLTRQGLGGGYIPEKKSIKLTKNQRTTWSILSNLSTSANSLSSNSENITTGSCTSAPSPMTARARKQLNIAEIIPVSDVSNMTKRHWQETLTLEKRFMPLDWCRSRQVVVFGRRQPHVSRDHRHRIVQWMSEACCLFRWTSQTFFTAVHAWDSYMAMVTHEVSAEELPKLSAACLYFGAQLLESAADENIKTLDEFTEMCAELGNAAAVREVEVHLVDTLQGISLARRTPTDFLLLYLAQLQIGPPPCPQLFRSLIQRDLLDVLWDFTLAVALSIYSNGLILDGLPGSHWVAATILWVLEVCCPPLKTDQIARNILREKVFHLTTEQQEIIQSITIEQVIKSVGHLIRDVVWNDSVYLENLPYLSKKKNTMPYDVIRHSQPSNFKEWPIAHPSCRIVQDVTSSLRAAFVDDKTPGNLNSSDVVSSEIKRFGRNRRNINNNNEGGGGGGGENNNRRPETTTTKPLLNTPHYPAAGQPAKLY